MAEFQIVAKEIERLCKTYQDKCRTDECPLYLEDLCYAQAMSHICGDEAGKLEDTVMAWAKKHPKPVYPTWIEWLKSIGVIPYMTGLVVTTDGDGNFVNAHLEINENAIKEMPIDIVKKLELKPVGSKE